MIDDEYLIEMNRQGFFPGPEEGPVVFLKRIETVRSLAKREDAIPRAHMEWVRSHLFGLFDFMPESLPCFYSNRSLMPWQAAACWVASDGVFCVQLKEAFRKGSYLRWYRREEVLAHEAVHAFRGGFPSSVFEEFFAYMTSESFFRRVFGAVIENPWEVWPFFILFLLGAIHPVAYWLGAFWAAGGIYRLIRRHRILNRAVKTLQKESLPLSKIRAILLRLTDEEIVQIAQGVRIQTLAEKEASLRWRVLRLLYL